MKLALKNIFHDDKIYPALQRTFRPLEIGIIIMSLLSYKEVLFHLYVIVYKLVSINNYYVSLLIQKMKSILLRKQNNPSEDLLKTTSPSHANDPSSIHYAEHVHIGEPRDKYLPNSKDTIILPTTINDYRLPYQSSILYFIESPLGLFLSTIIFVYILDIITIIMKGFGISYHKNLPKLVFHCLGFFVGGQFITKLKDSRFLLE